MANEIRHDFTKRVAVVTGGAQGIGLAVVKRLLDAGASVAIWDMDVAEMERAAGTLVPSDRLFTQRCDQSVWDDVQHAAAATEATFGRIDILVNNAGIAGPAAPVASYDLAAWRQVRVSVSPGQ